MSKTTKNTTARGTGKPALYMVETTKDGRTRATVRVNGTVRSRTGEQEAVLNWAQRHVEMGDE